MTKKPIIKVSFLRLMGAIIYDLLLVFSLIFTLTGIFIIFDFNKNLVFWLITLPGSYFYFVYSWVKSGQTLGMKSWQIKLVNVNYKTATIRFIASIFSLLIFGIGYFYILFNDKNKSLHDKISNTYLIYKYKDEQ